MPSFSGIAGEELSGGMRLDRYVAEKLGLLSRSQIKVRGLKAGVNGKEVKISRIIKPGDNIELFWNDAGPVDIIPEDIPLDLIYEDERALLELSISVDTRDQARQIQVNWKKNANTTYGKILGLLITSPSD